MDERNINQCKFQDKMTIILYFIFVHRDRAFLPVCGNNDFVSLQSSFALIVVQTVAVASGSVFRYFSSAFFVLFV